MNREVTVFAPATIANLGPGFDVLGVAIEGLGDYVTLYRRAAAGIVIDSIEGDNGLLPRDPKTNTSGIAIAEALRLLGETSAGVGMRLRKGLPLGSGLGSSGASAAAAVWACNALFGRKMSKAALLHACLVAEAAVSGWHADNVGPSLFGGFVVIRAYDPLDVIELPTPPGLRFVVVTPDFELPTRKAREAVPATVPISQHVANSGNLAALIAALFGGSPDLLGRAMQDAIVEPARAPLIPGFHKVKAAALDAGALACSISGAGPTLYALCNEGSDSNRIATAMQRAFMEYGGLTSRSHSAGVDREGARVVG